MSAAYRTVQWNRHKRLYDLAAILLVGLYIGAYLLISGTLAPAGVVPTPVILLMRATGSAAFIMLHVILVIGPLARLNPRFLPLLYNRRHLGALTFLVALVHLILAALWYHSAGEMNPLVSILAGQAWDGRFANLPFQPLGFAAFMILFLMAATSHDFWLKNLSPPFWKTLHMLVYVAYGLLALHVVLGAIQDEKGWLYPGLLIAGFLLIASLHLVSGFKEAGHKTASKPADGSWIDVGAIDEIEEGRAKVVALPGQERIAVFRHDGKLSAVTNVCAHQNGPLGEGRIIDGCITCPWHGFQFDPATGRAPPPFTDKIATFKVRAEGGRILLDPNALPPGTPVDPAPIGA
jgi:sulfoxide reductase heme-binding subunit YedZ